MGRDRDFSVMALLAHIDFVCPWYLGDYVLGQPP
jgi:hypothetical protein